MSRADKAKEYFLSGCNCSQSVLIAFADIIGIDELTAKRLSIGLGGGVGRMREVCGAVSASAMVLGALYSGENASDRATSYTKIQQFADTFKAESGSIICRELLGLDKTAKQSPIPEARTEEYYKVRPCAEKIYEAARILEESITTN
ncbi:MAG: C-GCAxxG-C-C family protein [Faecalibacterium sp.]|nr:C-GCAxxG-C-C family protein [Ruminococcus sp.]MCM1391434.1 C-GCAxxG-C-C family protein [Ruminococcus sp.]MCM1485251.1 C-GCAxxG-C-C family protein [Faecalibacterium sp.]